MTDFICYDSQGNILDSNHLDETMILIVYNASDKALEKFYESYSMAMNEEAAEYHLRYVGGTGVYIYSNDCDGFILIEPWMAQILSDHYILNVAIEFDNFEDED